MATDPTSQPSTGVTDEIIREEVQAHALVRRMGPVRRLYEWVLHWAETRHAGKAMALLAYTEAIFFPVPADVLLIALCIGRPKSSFRWAAVCTFWSILGGVTAMILGFYVIGEPIKAAIDWIRPGTTLQAEWYFTKWGFWTVGVAALTPLPYNVCSWLSGFYYDSPWMYVLASVLFRPMRFFGVAGLVYLFGPAAKRFIDKYFNLASWLVMALIIGVVVLIRFLSR